MLDQSAIGGGILNAWGEAMLLTVAGTDHAVTAAYFGPYVGRDEFGQKVERLEPEVQMRASDYAATGAAPGDTFTRADGVTKLAIVAAAPADADDWVTLTVREYTA